MSAPKTLPHSAEAERSVVGACLFDGAALAEAAAALSPADFYTPKYRVIFEALAAMAAEGLAADLVTLADRLNSNKHLDQAGGPAEFSLLMRDIYTAANIGHWIEIVKAKAALRRVWAACRDIASEALTEPADVAEFVDRAEASMLAACDSESTESASAGGAVALALKRIEDAERLSPGETIGLPTGYLDLDRVLDGWHPGELIILAARPSVGKSALAMNIAWLAATHKRRPARVYFASLEMSAADLGGRLLSLASGIPLSTIRGGRLEKSQWRKISEAAQAASGAPLLIDERAGVTAAEIAAAARRARPDLVIVDYLQMMRGDARAARHSREREIGDISISLKNLAKSLRVPVIALSQLNREVEKERRKPRMSDLRESGTLEQDADVILFLWHEPVLDGEPKPPEVEVLVAKQRNGLAGVTAKLYFAREYGRFENLAAGHYDEASMPASEPETRDLLFGGAS